MRRVAERSDCFVEQLLVKAEGPNDLQRRWSTPATAIRALGIALPNSDPRKDGAFMEPSGRNRWQPVANGRGAENGSNR
jgi:hypothetical protein